MVCVALNDEDRAGLVNALKVSEVKFRTPLFGRGVALVRGKAGTFGLSAASFSETAVRAGESCLFFLLLCCAICDSSDDRAFVLLPELVAICVFWARTGGNLCVWVSAQVLTLSLRVGFFFFWQDKLQTLAGQHSDVLESLTPNVRKRVEVLREIQACPLVERRKKEKLLA